MSKQGKVKWFNGTRLVHLTAKRRILVHIPAVKDPGIDPLVEGDIELS